MWLGTAIFYSGKPAFYSGKPADINTSILFQTNAGPLLQEPFIWFAGKSSVAVIGFSFLELCRRLPVYFNRFAYIHFSYCGAFLLFYLIATYPDCVRMVRNIGSDRDNAARVWGYGRHALFPCAV